MEKKILVRHDAKVRVVIRCGLSGHPNPCSDSVVEARMLDAHLAISGSYVHGKVSGRDSGIRVRATYRLVNPERDALGDGELCTCAECLKEERSA